MWLGTKQRKGELASLAQPTAATAAATLEETQGVIYRYLQEEAEAAALTEEEVSRCESVFALVSNLIHTDDVIHEDEIIRAQGADFKIFKEMDTHNTGFISLDEWIAYLGERKKKRGLHWLNTFLHTLERGCGKLGLSPEQIADINRVYHLIAGLGTAHDLEGGGLITQDKLIKAQGGNYRFFEAIDTAQTGHITPDQWLESLRNMHKAKGAVKIGKADRWLHSLLFTLERGCGARHFTAQQLAEAKTVFDLLASVETEDASIDITVVTRRQLIRAQGGDFKLFEKLDVDGDASVTIEEWLDYLRRTHAEKSKSRVERGDKWLHTLFHTTE